ncbi:hypothetical protein [Komagataeibacter oboediens]|uniref:hypothetical protein n=1 Tax=Komagataeibacter oboediens TaxID=65958 RepID=UPI001E60FF92|nr:hypothetical protein [Komagataeibacter oboediens]
MKYVIDARMIRTFSRFFIPLSLLLLALFTLSETASAQAIPGEGQGVIGAQPSLNVNSRRNVPVNDPGSFFGSSALFVMGILYCASGTGKS